MWIVYELTKVKNAYIELITQDSYGKTLEELVMPFEIKLKNRMENTEQKSVKVKPKHDKFLHKTSEKEGKMDEER